MRIIRGSSARATVNTTSMRRPPARVAATESVLSSR